MSQPDPWLPRGYELPSQIRCLRLQAAGEEWQIYEADSGGRVLIASSSLSIRWIDSDLLEASQLTGLRIGGLELAVLSCGAEYRLAPVCDGIAPGSKADALAFAAALRTTRRRDESTPLHDAIYVEEISRLLPTYTVSPSWSDDKVLGTWLTGGVGVSMSSRRRLDVLVPWLTRDDIEQIALRAELDSANQEPSVADRTVTRHRGGLSTAAPGECGLALNRSSGAAIRPDSSDFRLPGRPALERLFREHVIDIVVSPERYKAFGIGFPTAIALHGPPGCGKTYAVEKLCEFLDWPVFTIDSNSIGSPYIHETSKKVAEVFDKALEASPSAIIIDEMESYLTDRGGAGQGGLHHVEEVAEFLRRIPEANANDVLVIGMTNRIDMIDQAILRRGRFDHVVEVGMPSAEEVQAALVELLRDMPNDGSIDTAVIADALAGRPLSDAAYVVREAGRVAARGGRDSLDQACLLEVIDELPAPNKEHVSRPIGFIWSD